MEYTGANLTHLVGFAHEFAGHVRPQHPTNLATACCTPFFGVSDRTTQMRLRGSVSVTDLLNGCIVLESARE